MVFMDDSLGTEIETEVEIPKFVYHIYKDKKTGEKQTAITQNSAITRVFKALGWEFDATKTLDPEDFVNNWVEINIDDYEQKDKDDKDYTASTIKDINPYKGPAPTVGEKKGEKSSPSIEELNAQLAAGDITGDEFAAKVKKLKK
jgi:hypothetical protein